MESIENAEPRQANLSRAKQALAQTLLRKWVRGELQPDAQQSDAITPATRDGALPLSHAQERMWFLDQLEPGSPFYNMFEAVSMKGRLNVTALEQSLAEIVRRHEALRTTFADSEGRPVQVISPAPTWDVQNALAVTLGEQLFPLPLIDLTTLPAEQRTATADRLAAEEAAKPFDLGRGPLLRATLLRLDEDDHVLLLALHHIVADGWSVAVLIREVAALYEAFSACKPSPLAEPPIQYADYAVWQRDAARQAKLDAELDYWEKQLAGAPTLVELPTDRPRHSAHGFGGARHTVRFSPETSEALRAFARREGVSLFMTLLACWKAQLARESGQSDIVVGTRTAGRVRAELEGLIGLFVNALVLRTEVEGGLTFRELVARVQRVALEGFERQEAPFERLVQRVAPERGGGRNPLFNVMFVLHKLPMPTEHTTGLVMKPVEVESTTAKYDLDLTLWESGDEVTGWLEYSTELYDRETAARMVARFQRFVEQLVSRPDMAVSEVELLDERERRQVLVECNATAAVVPTEAVHELFAAQAARTPDAVAVADASQQVSYAELNRRANQLAHYLRARGVAAEVPVGVLLPRSAQTVLTLLAIYKAGGVYVPLDANYPASHLQSITDQTRLSVVVTSEEMAEKVPGRVAEVIRLDTDWQQVARESTRAPQIRVSADNLAYVMYTSGSTGEPKGVAVEHRQLLNRLDWMWREFPFGEGEAVCQRTTANFSVSMWELLGGLLRGCRTVVVEDDQTKDAAELIAAMARHEATRAVVVPSLLRTMLAVESELGEKLPATRLWSVCGEPLSAELAARFKERCAGARLVNQYGASELNDVCFGEVDDAALRETEAQGYGSVPVGRPVSNLSVYLLDHEMRPVGFGHRGEIYVRSISPARGYVGMAEATAERFVPDSVSGARGGRLYRTGDVGRRLADGRVEVVGRADEQVKVRGMRVEVKGVEALLRGHEGVREAAVVARREGSEVTGLVAYVVSNNGAVDTRELREWLRARTPEQMVPGVIAEVKELPRLPNGKVNRRALPDPSSLTGSEDTFVAPRTPVEEGLAAIWREVLGLERVGVNDRFFDLGGHSLLATRLIARVRDEFAVDLPLKTLFDAPTVEGQAIAVARRKGEQASGDAATPLPQITPDRERRHEPFPLTDIQQAYWIGRSQAFELGNVAAHSYMELESGGLDLARFNAALQRLIERHDMLRAVVSNDGQQQILESVPAYRIEVLNLEGAAAEEAGAALEEVRRRMSHQVLPSDRWPLFEIRATHLGAGVYRLHLSFDLLFADAWSWQILGRELIQLYEQPETDFLPLELSFRDYVLAEEAHQNSELYQQSLAYWRERLPTLPLAPELPLAQNPASMSQPRFARQQARMEPAEWSRLKEAAARAGLTPSGVLVAAFAEVLTAWSKTPRFTLNLTLFNRHALHPQVNQVVGDFTSLNLLAVDNTSRDAFELRARRLQEQLWDDLDHRYASGVRLLRELSRVQGNGQRVSLPVVFTSTLNLAASGRAREGAGNQLGEVVYSISQTPQVWLDHQVHEQDGALVFNWDSVEGLFPERMLEDMFDAYCRLLASLSADAASWNAPTPVGLPPAQLAQRTEYNATDAPVPTELLHELFAARVAERGAEPAVITSERTLTYEELARLSNQLGHRLREMGARPNRLVAIVMEKGWEQVVAALGILKAGGAYLPIDGTLPKERLWYLLEHSEIELVVTQSWLDEMLEWPEGVRRVGVTEDALAGASAEPLESVQRQDDLAYVIYTSGSSGLPKGVMIDHRGAVNTVIDCNQRFNVRPDDRVFAISSMSFDLSVYDVFGMLGAGGALVIPDAWAARDPAHWATLAREHKVTIWNSVPALMKILAEYVAGRNERLAPSLRLVMLSGDWLPVNLPDQIRSLGDGVEVYSLGGATEASIWSILYPIGEVDPKWPSIPYGRPMLNQQFHVLDDALEPRPVWVPGQLYIGGIGLAKGYWRDEVKSNASFFTHPRTGERLYRTGDLGRYLPEGDIEFLGREDFQVKIQGYRIELGEIEAALAEYPSLRACVVTVVGEPRGSKRLVAYIVTEGEEEPSTSELRSFLKDKLPDYMVPAVFTRLDALPLTSNGKVDRKALPEMARSLGQAGPQAKGGLPASAERIGELLKEFLKIEELEPDASLLELGASSVDMIRIANLLEKELGFRPQIDEFYREPTLLGLANAYEQTATGGDAQAPAPALTPTAVGSGVDAIVASIPVLKDPAERAEFKKRRPNLRAVESAQTEIELPAAETDEALAAMFAARRTHREFLQRPLAFAQLARLLGCLRELTLEGQPKYLYPSAGGTYPVQTYLHAKHGAIEGLAAGTYYYHPVAHRLVALTPGAELPATIHDAFINRPVFEQAGFSVFLVGQLSAVAPVYGRHSASFATLEAGYISQLLMMSAPACGVGLCPVGIMDFEPVRHLFALDETHVLLHSLLGGAVESNGGGAAWSSVQEEYPSEAVEAEREEIEL